MKLELVKTGTLTRSCCVCGKSEEVKVKHYKRSYISKFGVRDRIIKYPSKPKTLTSLHICTPLISKYGWYCTFCFPTNNYDLTTVDGCVQFIDEYIKKKQEGR